MPDAAYLRLSAGVFHSCGIRLNGDAECWGGDAETPLTPPAGPFDRIDVGANFACGVRRDRSLVCWGSSRSGQDRVPAGEFTDVAVSEVHVCGVTSAGTLQCWGHLTEAVPELSGVVAVTAGGEYEILPNGTVAENDFTCALRDDHSVHCFGWNGTGASTTPATFPSGS